MQNSRQKLFYYHFCVVVVTCHWFLTISSVRYESPCCALAAEPELSIQKFNFILFSEQWHTNLYLWYFIVSSPELSGSQGELIVYPYSGVRVSLLLLLSSSTMFKHLLLWNRFANQSQILCGASLGRGNESLYKWSWSLDQDGRHAHIW